MHILTRWNFRTVRANRSRTITVILAVVGFFALTTSACFIVDASARKLALSIIRLTGVRILRFILVLPIHEGLYQNLVALVFLCTLLVTAAILFSVFWVTADECLQDYRTLTSSGATVRQIRHSLLLRTLTLSFVGAAVGVSLGLLGARLSLGAEPFFGELPYFFTDTRTILLLSAGLLLAPCLMLAASALAFRRTRKKRRLRTKVKDMFRRSCARRVFGTGGVLGQILCKKNRRYRAVFTATFAICLAVLALLDNTLLFFSGLRTLQTDFDLQLWCFDLTEDGTSGTDIIDTLLRDGSERFGIEKALTFTQFYFGMSSYYFVDDDRLTDPLLVNSSPCEGENGKSTRMFWNSMYFIDDVSFAQLARENGVDPDSDGALFYGMAESGGRLVPFLKPEDPCSEITLHFLPDAFVYAFDEENLPESHTIQSFDQYISRIYTPIMCAPIEELLPEANAVSVTKKIRISGVVQSLPFECSPNGTLLLPERMLQSYMDFLFGIPTRMPRKLRNISRYYFLQLSDPAAGITAIRDDLRSDPRLCAIEESLGMGNQDTSENASAAVRAELNITDLYARRQQLTLLQALVPKLQFVLLLASTWILFIGIFNTVHMNRMTRRRENAILESIGMGTQQKTGMLLYESARYALCSAAGGLLIFLTGYQLLRNRILQWFNLENLHEQSSRVTMNLIDATEVRATKLQELAQVCCRTWWIFVGGAALLFVLIFVVDKYIERRSRTEDLIQILTDDSTDDNGSV